MRPGSTVLTGSDDPTTAFFRPFPTEWYDRPTPQVARGLLGQYLVHRRPSGMQVGRIVETEAYVAGDAANHASIGPTMRNRAMFGPPGTLYVYRIHQVCLANAVTAPGEAVLLRAAEPVDGVDGDPRGPGRLCRAFGIGLEHNRASLIDGPVRIAPGPGPAGRVLRGTRIGIRRDAQRLLRYAIAGNRWVSRPIRPTSGARRALL
ncbi:MAG TPA: DNA-3-methyladenine glycosylase [Thermoplasmata archaeon]|nr:DNA-3-methyladenine glycosylase [Thermoplasmata archaeon]